MLLCYYWCFWLLCWVGVVYAIYLWDQFAHETFYTFKCSIIFYIAVLLLLLQLIWIPLPSLQHPLKHTVQTLCASLPADVMSWPLRGVVTAGWQLRSGAGALPRVGPSLSKLSAGQAGRQAALQFDGRRKAGPKGTAARKRLELHWGCSGGWGGITPTVVKEEGSVWRRKEEKKPSKPDKASEKQCEDCRRKRRKRRERRSVHQGERTLMDFMTFCIGQRSSWTFSKLRSTSSVAAKLSRLVDKCAAREHWACSAPWKKLGDGEESFGGTALVFFPRAVFLSKDNARELGSLFFAWHRTTLPVEFGIYPSDLSWCRLIVE